MKMPSANPASDANMADSTINKESRLTGKERKDVLYKKHYIRDVVFTTDNGDMALVITGGHSGSVPVWERDAKLAMVVDSASLDPALPGWRERISNLQPALERGSSTIAQLCAGTPRVIHYLITLAHQFVGTEGTGEMQSAVDFTNHFNLEEVRDIAVLSHQYKALWLIRDDVPEWVTKLIPLAWDPEKYSEQYANQLEYLWISFEFGLESLFRRVCFNLAYVIKSFPWGPDSMPPGTFQRIYKCREAFTTWILTNIRQYLEEVKATAGSTKVSGHAVCSDLHDYELCTDWQLRVLKRWIKAEKLELDPAKSRDASLCRSPLHFLSSLPSATDGVSGGHEYDKAGCGLGVLVAKLGKDGKARLLQWAMEEGDEARPVTGDHIQYMAQQQEEVHWITWTGYTP